MPELAEIEVIKLSLSSILNDLILDMKIINPKLRYEIDPNIVSIAVNRKIVAIMRRAKYLIIELDNSYLILIHLGMTGRFQLKNKDYQLQKHDHLIIELSKQLLVYNDLRKFGFILYCHKDSFQENKRINHLGPEPLTNEFNVEYFYARLPKIKSSIKSAIMNNNIVVGIGNIYANEALFKAKIAPDRPSCSLSIEEAENLSESIKTILAYAIELGGSSIQDFVNSIGHKGGFQDYFAVYAKEGKSCPNGCGQIIKRIRQSGRSSFFCPNCQI
jgi:formamidopyrimidine-DNA glycosylase